MSKQEEEASGEAADAGAEATQGGAGGGFDLDAELNKALGISGDDDDEGDLHVAAAGKGANNGARVAKDEDEAGESEEEDEEDGQEDLPGEDDDLEDSAEADTDEDDDAEEEEEDEEAALEHAYEVLLKARRAPFSVLKSTPKAKLIAWAKQVEAESSEAAEGASSDAERGRGAPDGAKAGGKEAPTAEPDTAKAWAAMRASIAEKLGVDEESADGLKPLFDRQMALESKLAALEASREESAVAAREREGRATIDRELRRLERKFPGLRSDSKKVEGLVQAAAALIQGKAAATATEAFDMAARAKLGKARRSDLAQHRRNGLSSVPERRSGGFSGVDLSEDEYWRRGVDLAYSGRRDLISKLVPPKARKK